MDLDSTDCQEIAEKSYKCINIICRNKCPCPNCAEQNKQIYLAESGIYSFQGVLCIQKVGMYFIYHKSTCGATAALWFCLVECKPWGAFVSLLFIIFRNNLD